MPSLSSHHASDLFKLLLIGESGAGKTGSLVSLVEAGYNLRILDMDNGLDSLVSLIRSRCPDLQDQVSFISCRDEIVPGKQGPRVKAARAYVTAVEALERWDDGTDPSAWGSQTIFVLDSLTFLGHAALNWAKSLNPNARDGRQWYGTAQDSLLMILGQLTSPAFNSNVIVISHITLTELESGVVKGFPSAVGSAMGPKIGAFFNTLCVAETQGQGSNVKRTLSVQPSGLVAAKSPVSFESNFQGKLPLDGGLLTLANKLKGVN